jgi:segregation and condensation protein B
MTDRFQHIRLVEALLFASAEPVKPQDLARFLPEGTDIAELLEELAALYANRGVNLVRVGDRFAFRSAPDLTELMRLEKPVKRKLSRAAVETLAIIAYHQPVTRAEIEEIRGVGLSRGTLDTLLEIGWIKPRGRRRTPGRPVTWGTTEGFLDHFTLESLDSLPGQEELKAAGLLDTRPAITALGARGLLPPTGLGEEAEQEDEEALDEDTGETAEELLAADFGDSLLPVSEAEEPADEATAPTAALEPPRTAQAETNGATQDGEEADEEPPLRSAPADAPQAVGGEEADAPSFGRAAAAGGKSFS